LYFAPHAGCADSGDNSGLCEIEFRAQVRSQVQLGNEAQKLYFAPPVHTSGPLGIAGGMHTPQRVSGARYEIAFRNASGGEVVLRDPCWMRRFG